MGLINPHKIDLVGRMGRSYYVRASGDAILSLYQSVKSKPIGYESLPEVAKKSRILSGNDLGALAALEKLPTNEMIKEAEEKLISQGWALGNVSGMLEAAGNDAARPEWLEPQYGIRDGLYYLTPEKDC